MLLKHIREFSSYLPKPHISISNSRQIRGVVLNFGPQHPAAHGILRLSIQVSGELLQRLDPQFGLLHRGTEKLMEHRNYLQNLPYFDRFDYVANLFQEHVYCLAIEAASTVNTVSDLALSLARATFDELSRVLNHLLTLSAVSMDIGAMGPIFWAFEEREYIMELFERVSGARMHTALYKPFTIDWTALTKSFYLDLARFLTRCGRSLAGAFLGLLNNRVFKMRMVGVGSFTDSKLTNYGISGIAARSCGLRRDLRLQRNTGYGAYWYLSFRTFLGRKGDNLDRFLIRIKETVESFRLLAQCLNSLQGRPLGYNNQISVERRQNLHNAHLTWQPFTTPPLTWLGTVSTLTPTNQTHHLNTSLAANSTIIGLQPQSQAFNAKTKFTGMEELITHFRKSSEGYPTLPSFVYKAVESPKGEVGFTLIADGSSKPYRAKLRTPVSHNMHLIPTSCEGVFFSDFVATFCSLDIVLGEIDR